MKRRIGETFDKRVVNYAQWRNAEDFHAMQRKPEARARIQAVATLGKFEASTYEKAKVIDAEAVKELLA